MMLFDVLPNKFKIRIKKWLFKWNKEHWLAKYSEELKNFEKQNVLSMMETLEEVKKGKSLARFGDGEILLMCGEEIYFQKYKLELATELKEILYNKNEKLLVCLPTIFTAYNDYEKNWWLKFWYIRWADFKSRLNLNTHYGHSMVTRPDFFGAYKEQAVLAWKEVWNQKKVLFITGEGSKLMVDHSIFNNITKKEIIYTLPENAYDDLDRIVTKVKQEFDLQYLILIALGPSGTILAQRFSQLGYQAVDIGHITSSFEEVFTPSDNV
ncbi:GT-D fold domain-containing glycosyltransferase [Acinetobacter sp.]|uniref:GT-D fold domain-containing glycosyltransferase n=1 Tax=Acinetobacter sp. TaxID=472 RepID=UPI0031DBE51C